MELELEISESEDYSEFPAEETFEQRPLCFNCKRKATPVGACAKKEEKATQTVSRKSVEKEEKKIDRFTTDQSLTHRTKCLPSHHRNLLSMLPKNNWKNAIRNLNYITRKRKADQATADLEKQKANVELREREKQKNCRKEIRL